jgi:23S rRNA-/tRNA-specific pseudouridylate synthase
MSRYRVLKRFDYSTLIELEPVTGRTNQLRIHCTHIGHPIVGDIERGGPAYGRLCLHASRLGFRHPQSGEPLEFSSEPDFTSAVTTGEGY